jgi:Pyruvate/2-oxoacid:ferredoxin oxidoreductase gamma subunit
MLGALSALDLLPLHGEEFQKAIQELLPSHRLHLNMEAFDRGRQTVEEVTV